MNNAKLQSALNTLSLGIAELAEALAEGTGTTTADPAVTRHLVLDSSERGEFPPPEYEPLPFTSDQVESSALGRCPAHDRPWTVKAAGVSKAGKPYTAFFKCDGKDGDVFCPRKPVKAWADAHAAQLAAA